MTCGGGKRLISNFTCALLTTYVSPPFNFARAGPGMQKIHHVKTCGRSGIGNQGLQRQLIGKS